MKSNHTLSLWKVHHEFPTVVVGGAGAVCDCGHFAGYGPIDKSHKEKTANAERIVSCVNACAGINPESVADMIEALEEEAEYGECSCVIRGEGNTSNNPCTWCKIKAALAKAETK